jgi:hypothetical protein
MLVTYHITNQKHNCLPSFWQKVFGTEFTKKTSAGVLHSKVILKFLKVDLWFIAPKGPTAVN